MGCGSSKQRPYSARSWMATDGWVPEKFDHESPRRTNSGKLLHEDTLLAKEVNNNTVPKPKIPESRHTGSYNLGISDEDEIQKKLAKFNEKNLFCDDKFPADQTSLFFHSDKNDPDIIWKRPKELVKEPRLIIDGQSRKDVMQGALADCWFLSACAVLAQRKEYITKIVPQDQNLYGEGYKGVIKCTFWRFGNWVDVYIDDRLPVKNGELVFARCADSNEFWVCMVEKAYAKLHGSYEGISGGQAMDALVDFTGGIAERYELAEHTQELYQKLSRAAASGAFITCSRKGDWKSHTEKEVDEFGLVKGHAYSVTDVKRIKRAQGNDCLLRIRNPWGNGKEWTGAWSDGDHRWKLVDQETKNVLHFYEKEDGEFWMSYKDFCQQFQEATICTVGPDYDGDGVSDTAGHILIAHGEWEADKSTGGCRNDIESFSTNPQYLLSVFESDETDHSFIKASDEDHETASVVITVMQEHRRSQKELGLSMLQIGFIIYEADFEGTRRLTLEHFLYNHEVAKSGPYVNFREVSGRFELPPGNYVLVPSTYNKNEAGTFMIRVFCVKRISLILLQDSAEDVPPK